MPVPAGVDGRLPEPVPLDFTSMSSVDIGRQHSYWAGLLSYGLFVVGKMSARVGNLKHDLKLAKAAEESGRVRDLEDDIQIAMAQRDITRAVVEGYDVMMKAASREITRRNMEKAQT